MKKQYCISKDLINKTNVSITFDYDSHGLNIELSKAITDELSKWRRSRVNDLKNDIRNAIMYWFLYEPINDNTVTLMYKEVFKHLHQVY